MQFRCSHCGVDLDTDSKPGAMERCPSCGGVNVLPGREVAESSEIPTVLSYAHVEKDDVRYAGFWIRLLAQLIDVLLIIIACYILGAIIGAAYAWIYIANHPAYVPGTPIDVPVGVEILAVIVSLVFCWLYFSIMNSSRLQGTLGKKLLKIYITDKNGGKLTFMAASKRFFIKNIAGLLTSFSKYVAFTWFAFGVQIFSILWLSNFLSAATNKQKRTFHDRLAQSYVRRGTPNPIRSTEADFGQEGFGEIMIESTNI